jgi:hypothetical protein
MILQQYLILIHENEKRVADPFPLWWDGTYSQNKLGVEK